MDGYRNHVTQKMPYIKAEQLQSRWERLKKHMVMF